MTKCENVKGWRASTSSITLCGLRCVLVSGDAKQYALILTVPRARTRKAATNPTNYWSIAMANGGTPERQAKQAEAIRRWKPWERSTGPTTDEGKAVSSQNALVHGLRARGWLVYQNRNDLLRASKERLKQA
jgi:hypothetical protein